MCKPPPGMKKSYLSALSRRFASTALASVQDTTDVSTFQTLMAERCKTLPLGVLLAYAHTHVVFNQSHLLHSFIEQKAFLFKPPWFDWQKLQSIVNKAKEAGERTRSSNYRSTTLKKTHGAESHGDTASATEQRRYCRASSLDSIVVVL